jgi:hypothetical protein
MRVSPWRVSSCGTAPAAALAVAACALPGALAAQQPTGATFMNIGFVGIADVGWSSESDVGSLQLGDHDPKKRGFTIPDVELTLDGAVDPYFRGFAALLFKLDEEGESVVELEETYFVTTSLPASLQLKGGQFFAEFGRQNPQHPHSWGFVDQPLVLAALLGPEGLRSQGARLSWLAPTSFYAEAMLAVMNATGETAFSFVSEESSEIHGGAPEDREVEDVGDLLYVPRLNVSLDLSPTQTVVLGASAALGPNNAGEDRDTRIFGADLYWKWKSATAFQGFPFVSLQTEALMRRYDTGLRVAADSDELLPAETLEDRGAYAELLWGIEPRWVLGARGEFLSGDDAAFEAELRNDRYRLSPNLTWYPSEYSRIRWQYNFDHRNEIGNDHSFWMQIEFIMGAHAAHVF